MPTEQQSALLFTRCGQLLCGPASKWKEQFADMLQIKTNTVDNMSKGTSRVPPGIWREIAAFLQRHEAQAPELRIAALKAADEYTELYLRPVNLGRLANQTMVDRVNAHLRSLDSDHDFGSSSAWLQEDGSIYVRVPCKLTVEAVEGLKLRISKEIASSDGEGA